jgi:RNA polymerase sigma-70 factor, ECF subfamily
MSSYPTVLSNETIITRADERTADASLRVERSDNQLVDLVLAGDSSAFEQIFDRHKRLVALIARKYFRRPEEVEEIIQISFAKAYTEMGKFRGLHDRSFSSWLARITSNACFDMIRSQRRKPERLSCDLSEQEADALLELSATTADATESTIVNRDLVDKVLMGMPIEDRVLLRMMYAEDMSVADIADSLGCSSSNVKVRAWRARAVLRKMIRKYL